jgi:hypothetical protein
MVGDCTNIGAGKRARAGVILLPAMFAVFAIASCRKEEQAVVGVAHTAAAAEHKAQAAATELDRQRDQLARIPLPTKSLYINVHEPGEWVNPFVSVDATYLDLRVTMADANPSPIGQGSMLRPEAARRQELQIKPADLTEALIALPAGAWRYGRVVAVSESPLADRKKRPAIRRNVEAAIQKLNDLGVVVEEWPTRY